LGTEKMAAGDGRPLDGPLRAVICWAILGYKVLQMGTRAISGFHFRRKLDQETHRSRLIMTGNLENVTHELPSGRNIGSSLSPHDMSSGLFATISYS
jgi:hypothetical protein